jgi:hypothetical protein
MGRYAMVGHAKLLISLARVASPGHQSQRCERCRHLRPVRKSPASSPDLVSFLAATVASEKILFRPPIFAPEIGGGRNSPHARRLLLETECQSRSRAVGARGRFVVAVL